MTVYVDNARIPMGRMLMNHMYADTHEELVAMARKIGLAQRHIQMEGQVNEHFDVSAAYRDKAIREGAEPVTSRQIVKLIRRKRAEAVAPQPASCPGAQLIDADGEVPEQGEEFFRRATVRKFGPPRTDT